MEEEKEGRAAGNVVVVPSKSITVVSNWPLAVRFESVTLACLPASSPEAVSFRVKDCLKVSTPPILYPPRAGDDQGDEEALEVSPASLVRSR